MKKPKKTLKQILRLIAQKTIEVEVATDQTLHMYNIIGYYKGNLIGAKSHTIETAVCIELFDMAHLKSVLKLRVNFDKVVWAEFSIPYNSSVSFEKIEKLYAFEQYPAIDNRVYQKWPADETEVDDMLNELLDIIIEITQDQCDYYKTTEDQFATAIQEAWSDLKYNSLDIQKISSDAILHGLWQPSTVSPYNVIWYQINHDNGLAVYYDDTFSIQSSLCSLELSDNDAPLFVVNKEDLDKLGADEPIHLLINEFIGNFCNVYPSQIFEADLNGDLVFHTKPHLSIQDLVREFIETFTCIDMYE